MLYMHISSGILISGPKSDTIIFLQGRQFYIRELKFWQFGNI